MKEDARERIINESLQLFLSKGFAGSTTNELVTLAGVSKGSLYWHFKSKEDILCTILDQYQAEFIEHIARIVDNSDGDFANKFKKFYKFTSEFGRDNWKLLLVFTKLLMEFAGTDTELEKRMKSLNERYSRIIEKLLEDGINDGSVKKNINKYIYAQFISSTLMGSLIQWFLTESCRSDIGFNKIYAVTQRDEIMNMVLA